MGSVGPLENVAAKDYRMQEFWATCPSCGTRGWIDGDQYRGEISVDCPECDYHETHDHRPSAPAGEGERDEG